MKDAVSFFSSTTSPKSGFLDKFFFPTTSKNRFTSLFDDASPRVSISYLVHDGRYRILSAWSFGEEKTRVTVIKGEMVGLTRMTHEGS